MPAEPHVAFHFLLPAAMAAELETRHAAASGLPNASRSALGRAAAGAYLVQLRQVDTNPTTTRQRSNAMPAPPITMARHAG